ncbi:hypothetical protein C8F04DRAFT_1187435 [Mycena alexandri]|uniref:Uncharacterized protein n=1 Tax=Mycena alexandri TaxID=1745969 RepID=A0AAD6SLD2_9AGAR|nr:hypothetical protein C8F04DRAFT_1187435 [Mycena alexandri]
MGGHSGGCSPERRIFFFSDSTPEACGECPLNQVINHRITGLGCEKFPSRVDEVRLSKDGYACVSSSRPTKPKTGKKGQAQNGRRSGGSTGRRKTVRTETGEEVAAWLKDEKTSEEKKRNRTDKAQSSLIGRNIKPTSGPQFKRREHYEWRSWYTVPRVMIRIAICGFGAPEVDVNLKDTLEVRKSTRPLRVGDLVSRPMGFMTPFSTGFHLGVGKYSEKEVSAAARYKHLLRLDTAIPDT